LAEIILPRRFKAQPQYAAPLDAKWKGKVNFVSVTGLPGAQDRVSKKFPVSAVLRQATPKGLASYTGSGTNGLVWSGLTPVSNTGNGMAFLMLANPAASGTQGRALFLGNEASSFFNQCDLIFNSDKTGTSSSGIFAVTEYDNFFGASAQSIAGQMDGNWHVFIANRPAGDSTWALYRDGINVTDTTTFGTGIAMTAGVRVHCAPATTAGYTGNAVLAAVLTSLNRGEIADLSDNPWILFQAPARRLGTASSGTTLVGANSTEANTSSTGAITQAHALTGSNSTQANTSSSGAITQTHALTGANSTQANTASTAAISQSHVLAGASSSEANTASASAITQTHVLVGANSTQGNAASTGSIAGGANLTAASCAQANSTSTGAIAQTHVLAAANSAQANAASTGAISQGAVNNLAAANATQANTGGTGAITQAHVLVHAPSVQDNIAAASAIVQAHILAAANSSQGNAASSAALISDTISARRTYTVPAENREYRVPAESRTYTVPL
jgi:hypothetical protein